MHEYGKCRREWYTRSSRPKIAASTFLSCHRLKVSAKAILAVDESEEEETGVREDLSDEFDEHKFSTERRSEQNVTPSSATERIPFFLPARSIR